MGRLSVALFAAYCASPLDALDPRRKADAYSIYHWSSDRGLPSDKIRSVTQTPDGYLWIATAQGISRFDGNAFTNFTGTTNPELKGGGFYAVLAAPDGTLWAGGDNGLFRWDNGHFDPFTTADGLANNYVRALATAFNGTVVACTRTGYSFALNGKIRTPGGIWSDIHGVARSFLAEPDGSMLLGTDDGLWRIRGDRIEELSGKDGLSKGGFVALAESRDGSTWIGHRTGLRRIRADGIVEDYGPAQGLATPRVSAVEEDRDGNLWIATAGGLYRWRQRKIQSARYSPALDGATMQQLFEDREGALWIAAAPGLYRLEDNAATSIGTSEGLARTSVFAVTQTQDATWWIGLWNGGVYRCDQRRATRFTTDPMAPQQVLAFAEEPAGTLWIGAMSGLYRYAGGHIANLYRPDRAAAWRARIARDNAAVISGIPDKRTNTIAGDGAGGVWVGTDGGLYHSVPGGFRAYTVSDGVPGNSVKSVLHASNGDIWVSAPPNGVARLHDKTWTEYRCGRELPTRHPRALYQDHTGDIWLSTDGDGAALFHAGAWRALTVSDGLADNFITGVVEDHGGNLWLAIPRGVMRLERREIDAFERGKTHRFEPRMVGRSDGFPAGDSNQQGSPSMWCTRGGQILVATDRGVAVVEPDGLAGSPPEPPIYIERVTIDGVDTDPGRPITIPPGANDLSIHYTAIDTLAPERIRFRIRLDPVDSNWVDAGSRRDVVYAHLPPGSYEFSVAATTTAGEFSADERTIPITVRPFFYETKWFTAGLTVAIGLAVVLVFWGRSRLARRRLAQLEELVDERTQALRDAVRKTEAAVQAKNQVISELERSQSETALERARFKFIFDAVPIGFSWMIRGNPSTRMVNAAYADITGVPQEKCAVSGIYDEATHPGDRETERLHEEKLEENSAGHYVLEKRYCHPDGTVRWAMMAVRLFRGASEVQEIESLIDLTARKDAEAKLAETNRQLLDISRQAGMAEVAAGVLHNVGNVLNSVNVSATLAREIVGRSRIDRVAKLCALLREHENDLGSFMTADSRGRLIPEYLSSLADHLKFEQAEIVRELDSLQSNVAHIKEIVAMQESHARVSGLLETVSPAELVDEALRIDSATLRLDAITVERAFDEVPAITTEKHRVIQILENLIRNAKFACVESGRADQRIEIGIHLAEGGVTISVADNGVGIAPENLTRIFSQGFTTRNEVHGFGLHGSALAARGLGGSLTARSDGVGKGATFVLFIPK